MICDANYCRPRYRPSGYRWVLFLILTGMLLCCGWSTPATATTAAKPAAEESVLSATEPDPVRTTEKTLQQTPSLAVTAAKALGALAVVIGMLALLAAALKKLGLSGHAPQGGGLITVLDTKMLAPKKYVAVLDIAGQTMAVGVSEQQVTLLTKLEANERLQAHSRSRPSSSRFASLLSKAVNKNKIVKEDHS